MPTVPLCGFGASQPAAALEESSSSLEEMESMTRQNADNTKQAKALAESAEPETPQQAFGGQGTRAPQG